MSIDHYKLTIRGRVQGVFFRASTQKMANKLAISGTVKNTAAGDVEIIAIGEHQAMQKFIQWCHKGSLPAKVEEVIIEPLVDSVEHTGFMINH
ncbi:MAG: acylphosphatase [Gammaproteobacteria bacterium]|jgi:acylphosphatase|nr:acylphosphatase [Gammaproteobacteria bacterium]MBT4147559.1 acylphosphatase [Gammaproteobacteria bacterium]MBT5825841.1 acylphosphatase [Gammaproteobacteria bacterium]MBT5967429.1 acylphosphatase [Gammaproteobacteria bacterium]MBT6419422.1 acylphosphatase [Gammaproteobacteria bacterium]